MTTPVEDPPAAPATIDKETVQGWMREVLDEVLPSLGEPVDDGPDPLDAPATIRDIETHATKAVEDAMKKLRAAPKTKPKPKPGVPDPEPVVGTDGQPIQEGDERPPAVVDRLRVLIWGK